MKYSTETTKMVQR